MSVSTANVAPGGSTSPGSDTRTVITPAVGTDHGGVA